MSTTLTEASPGVVLIKGRKLEFPIEVRRACSWAAQWFVPAERAQELIAHTGLEVAEAMPGKSLLALAFVRYDESDLDAYNELAVSVLVRPHDVEPATSARKAAEFARRRVRAYIHHLPVTQAFTLEAGRKIWGYPKTLAEIRIEHNRGASRCVMNVDGVHALTVSVRDKGPLRLPDPAMPTYTYMDGVLRLTSWRIKRTTVYGRLGNASVVLGEGPIAEDLRALGLPKRAFMTAHVPEVKARFGAPEVLAR